MVQGVVVHGVVVQGVVVQGVVVQDSVVQNVVVQYGAECDLLVLFSFSTFREHRFWEHHFWEHYFKKQHKLQLDRYYVINDHCGSHETHKTCRSIETV